jgi:hypothetical protein
VVLVHELQCNLRMKNNITILTLLLTACAAEVTPTADTSDEIRLPSFRPARGPRLRFPIARRDRGNIIAEVIFGMDHKDRGTHRTDCYNYAGLPFPQCYNGHDGHDYALKGGFPMMDLNAPTIVAAAPGRVVSVVDGNYDRCHVDKNFEVTCDGFVKEANKVVIEHAGGWRTNYLHLKKNSIVVAEGDVVTCGQKLGEMGSSGNSSMPHLHFSLDDPNKRSVDPYAGIMSQPETFWVQQVTPDGLPGDLYDGQSIIDPLLDPECYDVVEDATECGTTLVTNAEACGTQLVTSTAQCGTVHVTSAQQCGTELVTSAQICGTEVVEDATVCGTEMVRDAARCGTELVNDLLTCIQAGLAGQLPCEMAAECEVALSCEIDATCEIPSSCDVPASCEIPATCAIPNSCEVFACE